MKKNSRAGSFGFPVTVSFEEVLKALATRVAAASCRLCVVLATNDEVLFTDSKAPRAAVSAEVEEPMFFARSRLPRPSSLSQKSNDHIRRIRYGSQQSQTQATKSALNHTTTLLRMYLVMCVTKMCTGRVEGIFGE